MPGLDFDSPSTNSAHITNSLLERHPSDVVPETSSTLDANIEPVGYSRPIVQTPGPSLPSPGPNYLSPTSLSRRAELLEEEGLVEPTTALLPDTTALPGNRPSSDRTVIPALPFPSSNNAPEISSLPFHHQEIGVQESGRYHTQRAHDDRNSSSSDESVSSSTPEIPPHRVRWRTQPLPPHNSSQPPPPPPNTAYNNTYPTFPSYPSNATPLWSPYGLRGFPTPSSHMTTTPWYYTPNPLPSMPMTSLPTSTPMSGANPYMGSSIHSTHSLLNQPLGPSSIRSAATPGPQISSPAAPSDSEWSQSPNHPRHDGEFGYTPSAPHIPTHPLHPEDHHSRGTPMGAPDSQYPQRHERFFFPDGDIDFRVHNVVFRVHRHFFRNLGFFAYPFVDLDLCGLRPSDFALLLSIFYPKTYGTLEIKSVEEWDSVLKVVTTLGMKDIQDLAATEILKIATPVDRIVLAKKYEIHNGLRDWTIPAFRELCTMSQPLSEAEGNRIGVEGLIDLAKMKHELQHNITQFLDFAKVDEMIRKLVEG